MRVGYSKSRYLIDLLMVRFILFFMCKAYGALEEMSGLFEFQGLSGVLTV